MSRKIQFRCQISPIMSAIRIGADTVRVQLDIPKSEHGNAVGLQALLDEPLKVTVEVDNAPASTRIERPDDKPKQKQPKPLAGPYSRYWERMCARGFKTLPDLEEVLDCGPDEIWDRLHEEFKVETMATVGPRELEGWIKKQGLSEGLITLSRDAEKQAAMMQN